jgi:hypothetical protein
MDETCMKGLARRASAPTGCQLIDRFQMRSRQVGHGESSLSVAAGAAFEKE